VTTTINSKDYNSEKLPSHILSVRICTAHKASLWKCASTTPPSAKVTCMTTMSMLWVQILMAVSQSFKHTPWWYFTELCSLTLVMPPPAVPYPLLPHFYTNTLKKPYTKLRNCSLLGYRTVWSRGSQDLLSEYTPPISRQTVINPEYFSKTFTSMHQT
jgi:hypothetical protein